MSCSHGCLGPKVSAHFSSPPSLVNDDLRLALDSQQATIPWDELTPQPGEFTYPIGSSNRLIGFALEPAFAGRLVRQLGAIFDVKLLQKLANVELDRVGAEVDLVGDIAIRFTLNDQGQDLLLQAGQVGGGRLRPRGSGRSLLQLVVHIGAVDGDGSFAAESVQELHPFLVGLQLLPMEDLEDTHELSARDQGHRAIGLEALTREERAASKLAESAKRGDRLHAAAYHGATGKALIDRQAVVGNRGGLEARARDGDQVPVFLIEHQDVGGVDGEASRDLVED